MFALVFDIFGNMDGLNRPYWWFVSF